MPSDDERNEDSEHDNSGVGLRNDGHGESCHVSANQPADSVDGLLVTPTKRSAICKCFAGNEAKKEPKKRGRKPKTTEDAKTKRKQPEIADAGGEATSVTTAAGAATAAAGAATGTGASAAAAVEEYLETFV